MNIKDQHLHILVLDPSEEKNSALRTYFEELGVEHVRFLSHFEEAKDWAEKEEYQVVVLTDNFGTATAVEALQFLRTQKSLKHLPYLLHTDLDEIDAIREMVVKGIVAVLAYPAPIQNVKRALVNCLRSEKPKDLGPLIKDADFFSEFKNEELQMLLKLGSFHRFHAGEEIISKGDPADSFYVLLQGKVTVLLAKKNAHVIEIQAGAPFGEMAILD